jgi:hypothetical protein
MSRVADRPTYRSVRTSLALVAVLVAAAAVFALTRPSAAPVRASAAGLNGQLWVMPSSSVVSFLRTHGVQAQAPQASGTVVVGRVSWTPRPGRRNEFFTVLVGDGQAHTGIVEQTYGPPPADVVLGNGSMWASTLAKTRVLSGDADVRDGQGSTSYAQFASVPSSWSGDVWFVAHVVDPRARDEQGGLLQVSDPHPVLVVALNSGDHVWWTRRLT